MSEYPEAAGTVNEDGSPALIEAVFYRHFHCYAESCDSVEEAVAYLESGADYGTLADVGVFVDGEPRLVDCYVDPHAPDAAEATKARSEYAKAKGGQS